jgi:hypothetical protein
VKQQFHWYNGVVHDAGGAVVVVVPWWWWWWWCCTSSGDGGQRDSEQLLLMHERQYPQAPSGTRLISIRINHRTLPLVFALPH